jgi:transposase
MPIEVRRLGRTIKKWATQITAWHQPSVSNGPTKGVNNLIKRIMRVVFGLVHCQHHRVRCLLYASKPDWAQLNTSQP